jgi:hypothetical protein
MARRLRGLAKLAPQSGLDAVSNELGNCGADIVLAALEAAMTLQDALLTPAALGVSNGEQCPPCGTYDCSKQGDFMKANRQLIKMIAPAGLTAGHELQSKAKLLQKMWSVCGKDLISLVANGWPEKRSMLYWYVLTCHRDLNLVYVTITYPHHSCQLLYEIC